MTFVLIVRGDGEHISIMFLFADQMQPIGRSLDVKIFVPDCCQYRMD